MPPGYIGITGIAFTPDGTQFGYSRYDATIVMAKNPFAPTPAASPSIRAQSLSRTRRSARRAWPRQ